ncbi:DUF3429 domain-containing protein [Solimicrobium silvestre]|uniref:DUF3429 domain-containing protein n=1 Tax=Solimicrobium silvestre TaxID=2099400 RepID=A0A2S9H256_9BURK|nr:DUF3429 domain-containing protein [Solimicrobium silvestre]PRC93946.1 hypothetical protein S2091_1119 [Solimicrobium silvestre]
MNHHFLSKRLAHQLGFVGLIPFIILSLACWITHPDWLDGFVYAQSAYGIAILSFLGGIHWGVALTSPELTAEQIKRALIWGVVPTMIAWCSKLNFGFGFFVLMFGFIASYQIDKRLYVTYQMPEWFLVLRRRLTIVVVAALALTVLAVNVRA